MKQAKNASAVVIMLSIPKDWNVVRTITKKRNGVLANNSCQ